MRNKYGIGFFATAIIAMLAITWRLSVQFSQGKRTGGKNSCTKRAAGN